MERANAAQMAARNIKAAKKSRTVQSKPGAPQSMSFGGGGVGGGQGGGLFGGGLQAAGTFNFSAPSGGLSFPPSPFGGNNMFGASSSGVESGSDTRVGGDEDRRKKSFRGSPGPTTGTPVQSNLFGQSQPANTFASANGQASNPFNFSQNASQPSSPGLGGFNSAPSQDKPAASNIFSFGGTPQPASPAPGNIFGSAPSQDKPASSLFSFGQSASQPAQQAIPTFNFGASAPPATQDKPTNNPFSFSQSSTPPSTPGLFGTAPATKPPASNIFASSQPSGSGFNFGSTPAAETPSANMFGTPQPPQPTSSKETPSTNLFGTSQPPQPISSEKPTTNLFGASQPSQPTTSSGPATQQSASSANLFAHLNTPAAPSNNLFGGQQEQKPASTTSTLFGGQTQQPPTANPLFGTSSQTTAKSTLFGEQKPSTTSSSLFSNLNKPAESTNNLFGSPKPAPMSNLFGSTPATSSNDLLGNLNKPVDQPVPQSKVNGTSTSSSNDLFGNLNKPVVQPAPKPKVNGTAANGAGSDQKAGENTTSSLFNKSPSTNLFGSSSSLFSAPSSKAEPGNGSSGVAFSFGASQPSASTAQTNDKSSSNFTFGSQPPASTSPAMGAVQSSPVTTTGNTPSSPMKTMDAPSSASQPPPSGMFPNLPPPTPSKSNDASSKTSPSAALVTSTNGNPSNVLVNGNVTDNFDYDSLYAEMAAASAITDEQMVELVPAHFTDHQKNEFYTAYRLRLLNKAIKKFFASVSESTGVSNLIKYYNELKVEILDRSSLPIPGSKRRITDGEDQENENRPKRSRQDTAPSTNVFQAQSTNAAVKHTKPSDDEDQENENPNKRSRQDAPPKSNLFQPQPQTSRSPEKSTRSQNRPQPYLNGNAPKAPSFAPPPSFALPAASPNLAPVTSPATKGKRKAEVQLTKDDHEREEQEGKGLKTPGLKSRPNGDSTASGGSNTSNIFKSIVDSPAKASPEKKIAPLNRTASPTKDDGPRPNPFAALQVPKSPTKPDVSPSSPTTANFAFTPNATSSVFGSMPAYIPNTFSPKPASDGPSTGTSNSAGPQSAVIKPPTFNLSGGDLMSQFAAKAKEDAKKFEKERMERERDEDMDSDEDPAEWEANWRAKEEAKKKNLENLSKSGKGFFFNAKKSDSTNSSTSGSGSESSAPAVGSQSTTAPIPLFGQPVQSSGNSVFNSRASTPGAFGSSTGSVLDGHISGQPLSGGLFFHLSDADSGADSGQADEDSVSTSDPEEDSENRDPNYDPDEESGSGPGTPVEETGVGIASTKKQTSSAPVSSVSPTPGGQLGISNSGTSTPGRSLFDRIQMDSNGKPVRQLSTEDQENTPPAATTNVFNPFSSLSQTSPAPANHTWNPNTPILFANTTPSPSGSVTPTRPPTSNFFGNTTPTPSANTNPTVSITEATPTRAPTSNMFGNINSGSTPNSPFSGLFGSSSQPPTSGGPTSGGVGFNFGQPSATSSLFPSAAASTTTSRATSPGNTTDGDSAAEDPDAENHEQLDLTSDGPGTEEEEKIYEVRAKATKWIAKEGDTPGAWKAMGVGFLRVFKHKETGATRVVLRAEPRGHIALNKALLANVDYKADNKTVKLLAAADVENGLETWILQVKTPEMAEALAKVLESNKPSE